MPQLDISTYISQIFWLLMFFGIILIFSTRVTLPRIDKKLRSRWQMIDGTQQEALKIKQSIDDITSEYLHDFEQAKKNSQNLMTSTIASINKQQAQQKADFQALYKIKLRELEIQLAMQSKILSKDVNSMATVIVTQVMQHLLHETVSHEQIKQAIDQAIISEHQNV